MSSGDSSSPSPPPPTEPAPKLPPPLPARPKKAAVPLPQQTEQASAVLLGDNTTEADLLDEDEISQQMTQSYSEISFRSGLSPDNEQAPSLDSISINDEIIHHQRPRTLPCDRNFSTPSSKAAVTMVPLNLEGSIHVEGNMTHFVTEDLETKIRLSSPVAKKDTPSMSSSGGTGSRTCTPNTLYRQLLVPQVGQLDSGLINDLECEAHRMATSIDSLIENLSGILHSISSITADNVDVYKNAVSKMSDSMDSNIKSMYTMMAKTEEVTQSMKIVERHSARIKEIKRLVDLFETFV